VTGGSIEISDYLDGAEFIVTLPVDSD